MARHTLKNAVVTHDGNAIDGFRQMTIDETIADVDLTAGGDAWQDHDTVIPGWTASATFLANTETSANQTLRAGDVIAFEGYEEGDASGKTYYSGQASVTGVSRGGSYDGEATVEYSLKGKGALSESTVTP